MKQAFKQIFFYVCLLISFSTIFHLGNRFEASWTLMMIGLAILTFGLVRYYFHYRTPEGLVFMLVILELVAMIQFWTVQVRNRAIILVLVIWFLDELLSRLGLPKLDKTGPPLTLICLIFIVLYCMIVFTLPQELIF
jgi:hypothetical protein